MNLYCQLNKVINEEQPPEEPSQAPVPAATLDEQRKVEQVKIKREKLKYESDLKKLKKNAKDIQTSTLRIRTNNKLMESRLHDIQESSRLISEKNKSIEDMVYRLLVRVDPQV